MPKVRADGLDGPVGSDDPDAGDDGLLVDVQAGAAGVDHVHGGDLPGAEAGRPRDAGQVAMRAPRRAGGDRARCEEVGARLVSGHDAPDTNGLGPAIGSRSEDNPLPPHFHGAR